MRLLADMRELPSAEEQSRDQRADEEQVSPLRHEEKQVAHPAVLGRKSRDQLRLGLGQIERRTIAFRERRDEQDIRRDEAERVGEHEPVVRRPALLTTALRSTIAGASRRTNRGYSSAAAAPDEAAQSAASPATTPLTQSLNTPKRTGTRKTWPSIPLNALCRLTGRIEQTGSGTDGQSPQRAPISRDGSHFGPPKCP